MEGDGTTNEPTNEPASEPRLVPVWVLVPGVHFELKTMLTEIEQLGDVGEASLGFESSIIVAKYFAAMRSSSPISFFTFFFGDEF